MTKIHFLRKKIIIIDYWTCDRLYFILLCVHNARYAQIPPIHKIIYNMNDLYDVWALCIWTNDNIGAGFHVSILIGFGFGKIQKITNNSISFNYHINLSTNEPSTIDGKLFFMPYFTTHKTHCWTQTLKHEMAMAKFHRMFRLLFDYCCISVKPRSIDWFQMARYWVCDVEISVLLCGIVWHSKTCTWSSIEYISKFQTLKRYEQ